MALRVPPVQGARKLVQTGQPAWTVPMGSTPKLAFATTVPRRMSSQTEVRDVLPRTLALPALLVSWTGYGARQTAPRVMTARRAPLAALVLEPLIAFSV